MQEQHADIKYFVKKGKNIKIQVDPSLKGRRALRDFKAIT